MYGAAGVDEFHAGSGEDLIDGGPGNDLLQTGWKDDDVIPGGDGNDTMFDLPFDPRCGPATRAATASTGVRATTA
jgi:hypothetical protein